MLKLLLLTFVIIGVAIAGIAVKMFLKKDGEFKKSCSSVDPKSGKRLGCTCGNEDGESACDNEKVN